MITGSKPIIQKEGLSEVIAGAATAIVKALAPASSSSESHPNTTPTTLSPGKCAEVHMKNIQQLRSLRELYDEGTLNEVEYKEQKEKILQALRAL